GDMIPFDTRSYLAEIAKRFENQGISDNLERICMDGYSKMAIYVKPTLEACLEKGIVPEAGFDSVASWIVYARKQVTGQCSIPYHDPYWDTLAPKIEPGKEEDLASDPQIWGDLPQRFDSFVPGIVAAIQRMDQKWQA
ncbi:MAG: mannitol dehydrogenase family protein, partial [Alphaproteobacteria bacterium]|nr:mannitol dehydrogenase family protein [Alphaproteobacteria bacterium]